MKDPTSNDEIESGLRRDAVPILVFVAACSVAIAGNVVASYLSYQAMDNVLLWTSLAYFLGCFLIWIVPCGHLLSVYVLTFGGWVLMFELLSNVVDEAFWLGGCLVGFDAVDELNSADDVG